MSLKISQPRLPSAAGGPAVVVLAGEIDVATGPQLRAHLEKLVRLRQNHLLLDLTQVSFLDSSGWVRSPLSTAGSLRGTDRSP
jgi:anti-anti-sigma regulatory factor